MSNLRKRLASMNRKANIMYKGSPAISNIVVSYHMMCEEAFNKLYTFDDLLKEMDYEKEQINDADYDEMKKWFKEYQAHIEMGWN